ncbi:MAG: hypothetical protein ACRC6V_07820 [Bacteroidales bacterium]
MKSVSVSLEELSQDFNFVDVIKETLDDRLIYNDGLESLQNSQLFALYTGDVRVGFYSIDDLGEAVEAHAYIFQGYRKYSIQALRHIISSQDKHIKTSVYGSHRHVVKFLTKVGFKITNILDKALVRHGETYDVLELIYTKENDNG